MTTLMNLIKALRENFREDENGNLDARVQHTLAVAIGMQLKVPAEPVSTSGINAYNSNHLPMVRKFVSDINELFLVDVSEVLKIVSEVYIARYNIVHNPALSIEAVNAIVGSIFEKTKALDGELAPEISLPELNRLQLTVGELLNPCVSPVEATAE